MKRKFVYLSILFIASIFVISCKNNLKLIPDNEYSTVSIKLGSRNARPIGNNGLPELTEKNTGIIVTDEKNKELAKGSTSLNLKVKVGTKIKVKVRVRSAGASWGGEVTHTVVKDKAKNKISIKLSSLAKALTPLVYSSKKVGKYSSEFYLSIPGNSVEQKLKDGISSFSRDGKGRIYCLNENTEEPLVRYNVDGTKDGNFAKGIKAMSAKDKEELRSCQFVRVDSKNSTVYLYHKDFDNSKLYIMSNDFKLNSIELDLFGEGNLGTMFIYNDTIFFSDAPLSAYKIDNSTKTFGVKYASFVKAPSATAFHGRVKDIYAEGNSVYLCVNDVHRGFEHPLAIGKTLDNLFRSRGAILEYTYDYTKNTFRFKASYGMEEYSGTMSKKITSSTKAKDLIIKNSDPSKYFYGPSAFLGKDEYGNLLIADDGIEFQVKRRWPRIVGNKNRIARLNIKTGALSFEPAKDALGKQVTWNRDFPVWTLPVAPPVDYPLDSGVNTNILLWDWTAIATGASFWQGSTGIENKGANELVGTTGGSWHGVFCYDQSNNLYILESVSSARKVRKYKLGDDNKYIYSGTFYSLPNPASGWKYKRISVDNRSEDGVNRLYYLEANETDAKLQYIDLNNTSKDPVEINAFSINYHTPMAMIANSFGLYLVVEDTSAYSDPITKHIKLVKYKERLNGEWDRSESISIVEPYEVPDISTTLELITDMKILAHDLYLLYNKVSPMLTNETIQLPSSKPYAQIEGKILKLSDIYLDLDECYKTELWNGSEEAHVAGSAAEGYKGYAPYRFVAIRPNKLVIASDGYYSCIQTGSYSIAQYNKILIFDLTENKLEEIPSTPAEFSRKLDAKNSPAGVKLIEN